MESSRSPGCIQGCIQLAGSRRLATWREIVIAFDAAHKAVHYPADRRFRIWVKPSFVVGAFCLALIPLIAAWIQAALFGLPYLPPAPVFHAATFVGVHGFPWWIRWAHFFNFVFLMMLVRSGLSILVDHPRLYFNNGCTPGTEWIRFTPLKIPKDRGWRARDDDRYISPIVALPGYRHSVEMARCWHFLSVYGFIVTGLIFIPLLFISGQWTRLVFRHLKRKSTSPCIIASRAGLALRSGTVCR
jgi:sulfoxide reductase catalytic subunit YedY